MADRPRFPGQISASPTETGVHLDDSRAGRRAESSEVAGSDIARESRKVRMIQKIKPLKSECPPHGLGSIQLNSGSLILLEAARLDLQGVLANSQEIEDEFTLPIANLTHSRPGLLMDQ